MSGPVPPIPMELLRLRSATAAYLSILRDIEAIIEQWADVNRLREPAYGELLDQVRTAQLTHEMGTPAAINRVIAELPDGRDR